MADGEIRIRAILESGDVEEGLKMLKDALKDLGGISSIFGRLGSAVNNFGKIFGVLSKVMGTTVGKVTAGIGLIVVAYGKLYEAGKKNFSENLERFGKVFSQIGSVVSAVGGQIVDVFSEVTGLSTSFSSLIASAIEFESSMARVSAIMGVTGQGIETITNSARQYGATTRYTSTEVAEAYKYMGMAGFSMQESMASIQQVLDLTTIGATKLGLASDIVTDGLTAFGMSANQAGDFVDYMAATITRSNTDVEMMGETLKYAGSVCGTLGISMADASVAIGLMAGSSVKASRAGTALRGILANLSAPSDTVAGAMKKYGISLITAKDGSVDLDKTLRNLRASLKGLPLIEQAAACKNLAGKTGMTGLLSIVNSTDEAYNSLTNSVQNSTQTVEYWNENLGLAGIHGKKASERISNLKSVLKSTEYIGNIFNATSKDMALTLQLLGDDAKVTAGDVENLFSVFSVMRDPSKKQAKAMKELGLSYREVNDDLFDYSKTVDALRANDVGLTREKQKEIKNQLRANMTMKEANEVLKKYSEYNLKAYSQSTGQIDMIANLKELRDTFGDMDGKARAAALEQLGLGDSIDQVSEICNMSDTTFKQYCENLKLVEGLSRKMADAMDETTKGKLLQLASAIEDVGIEAFERMKPAIRGASDSLTKFFNVWRSGNKKGTAKDGEQLYQFKNFKKAITGLENDIKKVNIAGAIGDAVNGAVAFLEGGGLSSILSLGTTIIQDICKGIIDNKEGITKAIDLAIKDIAKFVEDNADDIGKAGKTILDAIKKGIETNEDVIRGALDSVCGAMDEWVRGSAQLKSMMGNFSDILIDSLLTNVGDKVAGKASEWWAAIWTGLTSNGGAEPPKTTFDFFNNLFENWFDTSKPPKGFLEGIGDWFSGLDTSKPPKTLGDGLWDWLFPEVHADEKTGKEKPLQDGKKGKTTKNLSDKLTSMDTKELESFRKELAALETSANKVSTSVAESFNFIQSNIMSSMRNCSYVVREQMLSVTNIVRNQALNSANIVRNQFLNMTNIIRNQSVNSANIVRNQFLNMTNIIRSQSLNGSNIVRNQFVSMSNVIRNQMVNCSNIVRNQMVSISNVTRNQARNARNSFTTQFISLSKVARTQITQARNAVTSQMISMRKVVSTQAKGARDSFTTQMISIKNVARTQASEAGKNISYGLAAGLRSGTAAAVVAARNMVNLVNSVIKSTAKIHSPSKVTTEYGEFYGQGFGLGIKKSMPNVYKIALGSMKGLNDEIKSTVNAEMSKVYVSANANSTSNIKSQTTAIARLNDDDIEKLGDALSSRPNIMKASIGEKEIIEVVAEPVRKHIAKSDERNKRKKGGS